MDPFAQLPNEVLQEVFKHVPSLPGKFKLAAVNQKFRGGIMEMLEKPMDLVLNYDDETINGIEVAHDKWPIAVEVLAECTDFREIQILEDDRPLALALLDAVLDAILNILDKADCLNQTSSFESHVGFCYEPILEQFLRKCAKLSSVFLHFPISRLPHPIACSIDLRAALGSKALTHLELALQEYPLMELASFFKSLQPSKLKSCTLKIHYPLDLVQLVNELAVSAWAALERLEFCIYKSSAVQLELLELAKQLPRLRTCIIAYKSTGEHSVLLPFDQISDALANCFNGPTRGELTLDHFYPRWGEVTGCALVNLIRQLKHQHPELRFNHLRFGQLDLTLENLTLRISGGLTSYCDDEDCPECGSFFLTVVVALAHEADWNQVNAHLENHQLDRCKIGRVVEDLNGLVLDCTALSAVVNEAQDLATITFETPQGHEFYITVDCGPCFYNSCLECLVIV